MDIFKWFRKRRKQRSMVVVSGPVKGISRSTSNVDKGEVYDNYCNPQNISGPVDMITAIAMADHTINDVNYRSDEIDNTDYESNHDTEPDSFDNSWSSE